MLMAGCLLGAAEEKAKKPAPKQASRAAKPAAQIVVPADAEEIAPGTWRRQEAGKTWIYRQTPFGISRFEEKQAEKFEEKKSESKATEAANMRAFDDGDDVRFERKGPFGVYRWRSKKSELNDVEKQVWE